MNYRISHPTKILKGEIELTASKSESNRALIIQALCADVFEIKNLATAEDTRVLKEMLSKVKAYTSTEVQTYDVGAAGTTMRFLTAFLATQKGTYILTGSERMKNRPIKVLVDALRDCLGARIRYLDKQGYPPIEIKGRTEISASEVEIDGSVSSQYISALLLIAPTLQNGLVIKFKGDVTSRPYINMTLKMMEEFGVKSEWQGDTITINKQSYHIKNKDYEYEVEADWSSASYWYAIAALSIEVDFTIMGLHYEGLSLQGDAEVVKIFSQLGITSEKISGGYHLIKNSQTVFSFNNDSPFGWYFSDCPDLAQTIAVVVGALKIPSVFTGLHTLRIKETDRTLALKNELAKMGVEVEIVNDDKIIITPKTNTSTMLSMTNSLPIATYEDHRMAMAFAPLAMIKDSITIEHPEVVKKSYPNFWNDLKSVGFVIEEI